MTTLILKSRKMALLWSRLTRFNALAYAGTRPLGTFTRVYEQRVAEGKLRRDAAQEQVVPALDRLNRALNKYKLTENEETKDIKLRGLYVYGSVGSGKSMLMDLFFTNTELRNKRRVHFHQFMLEVHQRIHQWKQQDLKEHGRSQNIELRPERDAIQQVAEALAQESQLLCFDEFQITDIADAVIMQKLFGVLFSRGVVMIATSNTPPDRLYWDGINREYFLPFIHQLERHCKVLQMDSITDHRTKGKRMENRYLTPLSEQNKLKLESIITSLKGNEEEQPQRIRVMMGRELKARRTFGGVAVFSFDELCNTEKGAADYQALCRHFHTIVIHDIPRMTLRQHNQARRFITLIDELYEHRLGLICTCETTPENLFDDDLISVDNGLPAVATDGRSGPRSISSVEAGTNTFSSWDGPVQAFDPSDEKDVGMEELCSVKELGFAFRRAASRLFEMQTQEYSDGQQQKNSKCL